MASDRQQLQQLLEDLPVGIASGACFGAMEEERIPPAIQEDME